MSIFDSFVRNHTKVYWDTKKKEERLIRERQNVAKLFREGLSLPQILDTFPQILDTYSSQHEFKLVDGDPCRSVVVFTDSEYLMQVPRPSDGSIMYQDRYTKEASAISYDKEIFQEDMEGYWNG